MCPHLGQTRISILYTSVQSLLNICATHPAYMFRACAVHVRKKSPLYRHSIGFMLMAYPPPTAAFSLSLLFDVTFCLVMV